MCILLIADDPVMAHLLRQRLWRQGHVVAVAPTAAMGLQRVEGDDDAIILDVRRTDRDGVALTTRMRAAGVVTPLLLLSTRDTPAARLAGLAAGADDYIATPFSFVERRRHASLYTLNRPHTYYYAVGPLS